MTSSDDLADALLGSISDGFSPDVRLVSRTELRTLAREAAAMGAKTALEDAADELVLPGSTATGYYGSEADAGYREAERHAETWLRARAEQIGAGEPKQTVIALTDDDPMMARQVDQEGDE